jgi:broad specificity phosphatase PhoE
LNERGRWQAGRLAEALAGEPLSTVYSSPLLRTLHTAEAIADKHGLPVQIEPRLIEMDIGEADGMTFAEVRTRFPGLLEAWVAPDGPERPMPGGERLLDVQRRAWKTVQHLASVHPEQSVCVVTHNFVILSILASALGVDLAHFRRLRHSVAAVSVLDIRADRARLQRLNDTCHLEDAG